MADLHYRERLYHTALKLSLFTIFFNVAEGLVSMYFGYSDESLALFGFGVDSFIEVISGIGITHMIVRIQRHPESNVETFERTALKVTGFSFYALVLGLLTTSVYNFVTDHKPETTLVGVFISLISIAIMIGLKHRKTKTGVALQSEAIVADAQCTQVCIYMSVVLLIASAAYELTRISYIDIIGSLALAYLSYKEGRECFKRAKSDNPYCNCD